MGTECTTHEPLLLSSKPPLLSGNDQEDHGFRYAAKTPFPVTFIKWVLKSAMWLIFIAWASFMFFLPLKPVNEFNQKIEKATSGTIFGETGSYFLIFTAPVLLIAFLAIIYLMISGEEDLQEKKKPKHPRFRLWTFPVIVDGPFGVVNAAEFIGILLFAIYVIWAVTVYTIRNYGLLHSFQGFGENGRYLMEMLELTGLRFGFIGLICLAFLFLPVARGSVLLRLIDIPFEHATRYHVWLGHLTMLLFTLHGLFYVIAWAMQGNLIEELMAWKNFGVANLPGVVSLVAGLFMWVTSLDPVRRQKFELFFYTHQLYVVFVVFLALHVGDFLFMIVGGGIFLFMLDRFLRFFQSRKTVDILSAKCLPSGTVELVISKPQNLQYNALSWVFVQVPKLSWLQWHPFSVSSSPLDGKHHLAILIKVLGDWTEKLRGHISSVSNEQGETDSLLQTSFNMKASVEGPYGHESPYHLTYENLILVAGGIGISPFMAILRDILHHIRDNKPCLPRNVLIVWAVKKSNELSLLDSIDMESLCPNFYSALNLEIQTYVTRESEPPLEEGKIQKYVTPSSFPATSGRGMSSLVGTGNIKWSGTYLVVSTIGLVITVGLLDAFYIKPYNIRYWWYKGLLLMICMAVSVIVFGGFVIGLWHLWDKRTSTVEKTEDENRSNGVQHNGSNVYNNGSEEGFVNTVKYGKRPDFEEIFGTTAKRWGNVDIGVMVCGPTALQTSIAKECRSKNLGRRSDDPVFHFNSHSFDL